MLESLPGGDEPQSCRNQMLTSGGVLIAATDSDERNICPYDGRRTHLMARMTMN